MLVRALAFLAVFTPWLAWEFFRGYQGLATVDPEGFRGFETLDPYGLVRIWFLLFGLVLAAVPAALGHLAVVRRDRGRLDRPSRRTQVLRSALAGAATFLLVRWLFPVLARSLEAAETSTAFRSLVALLALTLAAALTTAAIERLSPRTRYRTRWA